MIFLMESRKWAFAPALKTPAKGTSPVSGSTKASPSPHTRAMGNTVHYASWAAIVSAVGRGAPG